MTSRERDWIPTRTFRDFDGALRRAQSASEPLKQFNSLPQRSFRGAGFVAGPVGSDGLAVHEP